MVRIITKKGRILNIVEQIRALSDENGKLEANQVNEVQITYALVLTLVKRLSTFNAMDDLAMMEKSTGEVMEIAAKLAAFAKNAKEKEADPYSMETNGNRLPLAQVVLLRWDHTQCGSEQRLA